MEFDDDYDYYELLQISSSAEAEIISAAFRRLALKYHPDSGGSKEMMQRLNKAHDILSDPIQRAKYDNFRGQEKAKRERINAAKILLDQKKYDDAKNILTGIDHPTAYKWLGQIDRILAQQASVKQTAKNEDYGNNNSSSNFKSHKFVSQTSETPDIDELAERRIKRIREKEEARDYEKLQKEVEEQLLLKSMQAHEQVILRTYEKIGHYAFQWEGPEPDNFGYYLGNPKIDAWNVILVYRYEEARHYIKTSSKTDQNMQDWLIIINHILLGETIPQKIARLGIGGLISYQFWNGLLIAILTWTIYFTLSMVIIVISMILSGQLFHLTYSSIFIASFLGAFCFAFIRIVLDR